MDILPDFERLDVVRRWENRSSLGVIIFVSLMVVCEMAVHWFDRRKDDLTSAPRFLSTRQKQELLSALRREIPIKVGLSSSNVREHQVLLSQMERIFADAGWQTSRNIVGGTDEGLESGVLFVSYAGNDPPSSPDFHRWNAHSTQPTSSLEGFSFPSGICTRTV
jgi:hypothetical protein